MKRFSFVQLYISMLWYHLSEEVGFTETSLCPCDFRGVKKSLLSRDDSLSADVFVHLPLADSGQLLEKCVDDEACNDVAYNDHTQYVEGQKVKSDQPLASGCAL